MKGNITTDITKIQRIIRGYDEQFYAHKSDNLEEIEFLEIKQPTKSESWKEENLKRPITSKETE